MKATKKTLLLCGPALLLCCAYAASAQNLVWSDDFTGTDLDLTKWTFDVGGNGFGNQELEYYTSRPENVKVQDGNLVITARREAYSGKQFTSARLKSLGRFAFKYGRIEARVKIPNLANGLWPAFWLLGDDIAQHTWPACGEIDILEMGSSDAVAAGQVNRWVGATTHWDYNGSYANYGTHVVSPADLTADFHLYRLDWTPTYLKAYLDGFNYYTLDISNATGNSMEELHDPFFIIMNLAVGGINFVNITDPAQITAPFPAQLLVDYVKVWDLGNTVALPAYTTAKAGPFGIYTETTPVNSAMAYGTDADLFTWNNMTPVATTPYEGSDVMSFRINSGAWYGMGVYCRTNKNMQYYSEGELHFHMKTTTTTTIGVGVESAAGGEAWVNLASTGEQYGLVRDGQWHEVVIPLSKFGNVDFNTIAQIFMVKGDAPTTTFDLAIDNVYWTPTRPLQRADNGSFGIYTETPAHQTAGAFTLGVDGQFFVWENTLVPGTPHPFDGTGCISLNSAAGLNWFGAAFTPNNKYNLSAFRYPTSTLHFAMKTSSIATFQIGLKTGNLDDIGQKWITFTAGSDPYGFARDGNWHAIDIPMSDIAPNLDLTKTAQLLELLGTTGPISNIEIDDVALLNGGDGLPDALDGSPFASAGGDRIITLPVNSLTLNGTGYDANGSIIAYQWAQVAGPAVATLTNANTANLTASNLVAGTYTFRLAVTDNSGLYGLDTVQVTVSDPHPTANAGADQNLTLPTNSATLAGSGWDSDGTIVGYAWRQVSGPLGTTMTGANTATLTAASLLAGTYVFELTVTDNSGLTGSDQVTVTVTRALTNLARGKTATASSVEGAYAAGLAVDGSTTTRWSSAAADPQWIKIDLGATYQISQVTLRWETASAKAFTIDVSPDGTSNWTTIYSTTAGPGGVQNLTVSGSGRFIRMNGTLRNTQWGYSLFEFEVYGPQNIVAGDGDRDGLVNWNDVRVLLGALGGPGNAVSPWNAATLDTDTDVDIDLADVANFDRLYPL